MSQKPPATAKPGGGILPVSAAQTQQANSKNQPPRGAQPAKLKVIVRRLPPGLTEDEFKKALGHQWLPGSGKTDWFSYSAGKISKDFAKPSKPSRAYLQVSSHDQLEPLAAAVRATIFQDVKNTLNDSCLLGPPTLEFAPYNRVPASKRRNDPRQGLIDMDSEFQQFLESLTNPTPKPEKFEVQADKKEDAVTVTPLIQHIRDKKAAKEKAKADKEAGTTGKGAKHARQSSKPDSENKVDVKADSKPSKDSPVVDKKASRQRERERPSKAGGKAPRNEAPVKAKGESMPGPTAVEPPKAAAATESAPRRTMPGSPATAAARMIQRDLGLRSGSPRGRGRPTPANGRPDAQAAAATTPSAASSTSLATSPTQTPTAPAAVRSPPPQPARTVVSPPTAPRSQGRHPPAKQAAKPPPPNQQAQSGAPAAPKASAHNAGGSQANPPADVKMTSGATQAFLKHANASQGITELNLHAAMSAFGAVKFVEIDKRKGFAYVEFDTSDGLREALRSSPVAVASGAVQVLERRDTRGGGANRGGGAAGRGGAAAATTPGSAASSNATAAAARAGPTQAQDTTATTTVAAQTPAQPAQTQAQPQTQGRGGFAHRGHGHHGRGAAAAAAAGAQTSASGTAAAAAPGAPQSPPPSGVAHGRGGFHPGSGRGGYRGRGRGGFRGGRGAGTGASGAGVATGGAGAGGAGAEASSAPSQPPSVSAAAGESGGAG